MANLALWSHDKFSEYFKSSPRRAFEFRRDTLGDPIPEEHLTPEEKEAMALLANFVSDVTIPGEAQDPVVDPVTPVIPENTGNDGSNPENPLDSTVNPELGKIVEPGVPPMVTDPVVETKPEDELVEVEMTRDELKAKLDEKGIKYFKGASSQKLADLCVEHNLL